MQAADLKSIGLEKEACMMLDYGATGGEYRLRTQKI